MFAKVQVRILVDPLARDDINKGDSYVLVRVAQGYEREAAIATDQHPAEWSQAWQGKIATAERETVEQETPTAGTTGR